MTSQMNNVRLSNVIAPSFYTLVKSVKKEEYTHYKLPGGRGSTKSSAISVIIPMLMMMNPKGNAVVFRKVGNTLRESVYEQLLWGIEQLGVSHLWKQQLSPLKLIYIPTGQVIIFRGLDDAQKAKSIKTSKGYFKYIWFEERAEMSGEEEERVILQSLMRGGPTFTVFYSWNPPKSINNWVNQDILLPREDTLVLPTDYRSVPQEWLGEQFIIEAEHLRKAKPDSYRHEYLGEAIGTGGKVFDNVNVRIITNEEIEIFDKVYHGLDFGFAADPCAYTKMYYDKTRRRLFIYGEIYQVQLNNLELKNKIKKLNPLNKIVVADSAEPRTINELRQLGININGAKKGPGSVEHGISWLQQLEEIVICPVRCPNVAREFSSYELAMDKNGNFKGGFPDKDNHSLDSVRYALEEAMIKRVAKAIKKSRIGL